VYNCCMKMVTNLCFSSAERLANNKLNENTFLINLLRTCSGGSTGWHGVAAASSEKCLATLVATPVGSFEKLWLIGSAPKKQFQVLRKSNKTVCKTSLPSQKKVTTLIYVRWCSDQMVTGSNPTAVSMSLCPWARHFPPKLLLWGLPTVLSM